MDVPPGRDGHGQAVWKLNELKIAGGSSTACGKTSSKECYSFHTRHLQKSDGIHLRRAKSSSIFIAFALFLGKNFRLQTMI